MAEQHQQIYVQAEGFDEPLGPYRTLRFSKHEVQADGKVIARETEGQTGGWQLMTGDLKDQECPAISVSTQELVSS